jgi:hypothetical protein
MLMRTRRLAVAATNAHRSSQKKALDLQRSTMGSQWKRLNNWMTQPDVTFDCASFRSRIAAEWPP